MNAMERAAMQRGLAGQVHASVRLLERTLADVGGADTREMRKAGQVLARELRRQVNKKRGPLPGNKTLRAGKGKGAPLVPRLQASAPGEAPTVQTRRLLRSIGTEVVGGVRRVGYGRFTAPLLDAGVSVGARSVLPKPRRGKQAKAPAKPTSRRAATLAPRALTEPALSRALPKMEDVMVDELQRRDGGLLGGLG